MTTVLALGGNALLRRGERGTTAEQRANMRDACAELGPLLDGPVVVTHGNGPQVGNELLRHERAADEVPPLPLWVAVAQTQAEIGTLLESELTPVAGRAVTCVLTHVLVDPDDAAFDDPTKPVGPFYDEARARELERDRGWRVVADSGRGWRRVVPSPRPLEVIELEAVRSLLDGGSVAVSCGGGGIPVVRRDGRLFGVDAVIDKDRASALLAIALGADRLVVLTEVHAVYRRFGEPGQEELRELTADEADALAPELAAGSMRPKVEACAAFVRATGGIALIASPASVVSALAGRAGTRVSP
jgi:carbamate kinase